MTEKIPIRYLADDDVEKITTGLLRKYGVFDTVPVPIERIIDNEFRINIIPFPNLFDVFGINSCLSGDLKSLYIDEHLCDRLPLQYNFALAHELGHIHMHANIYKQRSFSTIEGYKAFIREFDEAAYAAFEAQAHNFAGHFLVPSHHLDTHFKQNCTGIDGLLAKIHDKSQKIDILTRVIAERLSPIFQVHQRPISIRIEKSRLVQKIFKL
jgi:Zn-dependent peptidase ImmA (M78 family)